MTVASVASYVLLDKVLLLLQPVFRHPSVMQPWQHSGKKQWVLVVSGWVVICDSWTFINVLITPLLPFPTCVGHELWLREELVTQPQHWPQLWEAARRNGSEERMPEVFPFLFLQITEGSCRLGLPSWLRSSQPKAPWSCSAPLARLSPKAARGHSRDSSSGADHRGKTWWGGRGAL